MVYTVINAVARFTGFNYRSIQVCCTTTFFVCCLLLVKRMYTLSVEEMAVATRAATNH
jgi:hypothetical protein